MNPLDEEEAAAMEILFSSSSSSSDDDEPSPPKRQRRSWVRAFYKERNTDGAFITHFTPMKMSDPQLLHQYIRMSAEQFEELLGLVAPLVSKMWLTREPISESCRLAMTLRYLANGESQRSIALNFKCSPTVVHRIIPEICSAIQTSLKSRVFRKISTESFAKIADEFNAKWQFPHCIGAIDGKHIQIQAPPCSGSEYFNYKKTFSVVLMAISDANYCFVMCELGAAGKESDNGVFQRCNFGKLYYSRKLPIPPPSDVSEEFTKMPYVFIGDDAFPLETTLMKPFSHSTMDENERIFNYRLSRARRVVENAFGILVSKWRIFRQPIIARVENVGKINSASVCLHNWLRLQNSPQYLTPNLLDTELNGVLRKGEWRSYSSSLTELSASGKHNSYSAAKETRKKFMHYFTTQGSVPWQWNIVSGRAKK